MEIVNCIGFNARTASPLDKVMEILSGFTEKKHNNRRQQRVFVPVRKERGTAVSSFDFRALLRGAGIFCTEIQKNIKFVGLCAAGIAVSVCLISGIFYGFDYFQTKTGPVSLENNYEKEMALLDELMNSFALEENNEYSNDGTILDSKLTDAEMEKLFRQPVTFQTYRVQSGDTISGITKKFGLSNISTLIAVNDIDNVRQLCAGQKLRIPSMDGLYYTVQRGNSLQGLSSKFGVTMEDLLDVNELESEVLSAGQVLFIPGAKLEESKLKQAMGELFKNPLSVKYRLTSRFGPRADPFTGAKSNHTGIDMACATGTPIVATASGYISYSGTSPVYGYYVIINHGNGYQSLYGHMSKIIAKKGQWVSQGTRIGLVGSTGYSTGPHLHFTVFKNGKLVDPLSLIK